METQPLKKAQSFKESQPLKETPPFKETRALKNLQVFRKYQALKNAREEWTAIFAGGPYTGLKMLEYIMKEGGKTPHEFLANPRTALARITPDIISKQDIDKMAITWAYKTGRCTSLAVKAAHNLAEKKVGGELVYDWCIYDLNHHRVARCRKTGIVIDSSSKLAGGAFHLPEGRWARFDKTDASWKFKSSECKV